MCSTVAFGATNFWCRYSSYKYALIPNRSEMHGIFLCGGISPDIYCKSGPQHQTQLRRLTQRGVRIVLCLSSPFCGVSSIVIALSARLMIMRRDVLMPTWPMRELPKWVAALAVAGAPYRGPHPSAFVGAQAVQRKQHNLRSCVSKPSCPLRVSLETVLHWFDADVADARALQMGRDNRCSPLSNLFITSLHAESSRVCAGRVCARWKWS